MRGENSRGRPVRRPRLVGAAVVLAVAAAAGVAVGAALTSGHSGGGTRATGAEPSRAPASWYPAGPLPAAGAAPSAAPYFVSVVFQRSPAPVTVTDAFTGRVLATVSAPVKGPGFVGVAAAGDDRTFVLAAQESSPAVVWFYELRLSADGKVGSLTRLTPVASPGVPAFAVSPDASRLAYATPYGIQVVSLATGAIRDWAADGDTVVGYATELSWAGDQTIAMYWASIAPGSRQTGVRLLDTSAPGSDLLSSRQIIGVPEATAFGPIDGLTGLLATPDGSKVFATVATGLPATAEVVEFSARTGRALAVVSPRAGESGMGSSCLALWTDPSGERLTAECGQPGAGTIDDGHFVPAALHVPSYNFSTGREAFIAW